MNSDVSYATTPLALASLAIIVGVGILKLLVAKKNNAINRLITHYGFAVVIVFGLLGNLIYLYGVSQSSETLIFGSVVDDSGQALANVKVDAGGHARGMTNDSGDFVLAIPASRVQPRYELHAMLPGHRNGTKTVDGASRMFVRLELQVKRYTAADVLKLADPAVIAGHYMGLPELYVPILIENPGTTLLTLNNFSLTVRSPSGRERQLIHANSAASLLAPVGPPLPQVQVKPGDQFSWVNAFVQTDHRIQQLSIRAMQAVQSQEEFRVNGPRVGRDYLSPELDAELRAALANNWFWEPGDTTIRLTCNANGTPYDLVRRVTLTDDQIKAMRQSSEYYRAGYGIIFGSELMAVETAQPGQRLVAHAD